MPFGKPLRVLSITSITLLTTNAFATTSKTKPYSVFDSNATIRCETPLLQDLSAFRIKRTHDTATEVFAAQQNVMALDAVQTKSTIDLYNRSTGFPAGTMAFEVNGPMLNIDYISSREITRYNNVSATMLARLLITHPDANTINAPISGIDLDVYLGARKNGHSHKEALQSTPLYKAAKSLNFGRINLEKSYAKDLNSEEEISVNIFLMLE